MAKGVEAGNSKKQAQKLTKPENVKPGKELEKKMSRKTKHGKVDPVAESRGANRKHSTTLSSRLGVSRVCRNVSRSGEMENHRHSGIQGFPSRFKESAQ